MKQLEAECVEKIAHEFQQWKASLPPEWSYRPAMARPNHQGGDRRPVSTVQGWVDRHSKPPAGGSHSNVGAQSYVGSSVSQRSNPTQRPNPWKNAAPKRNDFVFWYQPLRADEPAARGTLAPAWYKECQWCPTSDNTHTNECKRP